MKAILFALCLVTVSFALSVEQPKVVSQNDEWCSICQFAIGYIEGELANNRTEENIIHVVQTVCTIVPKSFQAQCDSLIAVYGEDIIQLLINDEPASVVCAQIGLCDSSKVKIQVEEQKGGSDDCSVCQFLMGYVESAIGNNNTVANIEQVLDEICSFVPSAFQAQCTSLINAYTNELIQLLINDETPQVICQQIGLCSSTKNDKIVIVESDEYCTICEYVMSAVDQYLGNNATEKQVILFIENVCYILPSTVREDCDNLIETYATEIITLLIQDYPPNVVCTELSLCSSSKTKIQIEELKGASDDCSVCQFLMGYVESAIGNNNTVANIEQVLDEICSFVPSAFQAQCTSMINAYTNELIQLLINDETPQVICQQIGLCSSKDKIIIVHEKENFGDEYCTICEFVMSTAEQYLSQNATDKEIILFIENVCYILPGSVRQECDDLIATYATEIITLLVQDYAPSQICSEIGLCSSTKKLQQKARATPVQCELCIAGITAVEKLNLPTPKAIITALLLTCDPLPQPAKGDCQTFIQTVAQAVVVPIQQKQPAPKICASIGICTQQ